jgi:hypothetical protein
LKLISCFSSLASKGMFLFDLHSIQAGRIAD